MNALAGAALMIRDLGLYAWRSGRWWVPALVVAFALVVVLAVTAKVVVPVAVYTLF